MNYPRRFQIFLRDAYPVEQSPGVAALPQGQSYADWLEPVHMTHGCSGTISEFRCVAHKHPEDARKAVKIGQAIQVADTWNNFAMVFDGVVRKRFYHWGGESEDFQLVCYSNGDDILFRDCVHGQWRRNATKEQAFYDDGVVGVGQTLSVPPDAILIDTPCVFNPEGLPNATSQTYSVFSGFAVFGTTIPIFDVPGRQQMNGSTPPKPIQSALWTAKDAVGYLLVMGAAHWGIDPASFNDATLGAVFGANNPVISNINVEGKPLLEALRSICEPLNIIFSVDPFYAAGATKHSIRFYFRGQGPAAPALELAPRGTTAAQSKSNLIDFKVNEDSTPVVNNIEAYGDRIQYTTLASTNGDSTVPELFAAWDGDELSFRGGSADWPVDPDGTTVNWLDTVFTGKFRQPLKIVPGTGHYGVGVCWMVNLGEVPDFPLENLADDTTGDSNSVDQRRFEKPTLLQKNGAGGSLRYEDVVVEMSTDGGGSWGIVERNFYTLLEDGMGVVFNPMTAHELGYKFDNAGEFGGKNYWQALKDRTLRIRILCSIKSDKRVEAKRLNAGASFPLAVKRVYDNPSYRKFVYNPNINGAIYYTTFPPLKDTTDNTQALSDLTTSQADNTDALMFSGEAVVVLGNVGDYKPGQTVSGIKGRDVVFSSAATILQVTYDFPNEHVHLTLDNHRIPVVLKARIAEDRTEREHKLGIGPDFAPVQGQKVPFDPVMGANNPSYERFIQQGGK